MRPYTKDRSFSFPARSFGRSWIDGLQSPPAETLKAASFTVTRKTDGYRLDNWRTIIAAGQNATTPYSGTWDSFEYKGSGSIRQEWTNTLDPSQTYKKELDGAFAVAGSTTLTYAGPSIDISFVENLARASFYNRLSKEVTKFQGKVFAGELKETLHMLRSPAASLRNLAKDFLDTLRKRKRANPKGWTRDIGSAWLENAFGWQPLLNDIKDAYSAYESVVRPKKPATRISAGAAKSYDNSTAGLSSEERAGGTCNTNLCGSQLRFNVVYGLLREHHIVRYRGAVQPRTEAPSWNDSTLWGFNPESFIPSKWELLPWSFLIDYFTNIGDILNAHFSVVPQVTYAERVQIRQTEKYRKIVLDDAYRGGVSGSNWTLKYSSGGYGFSALRRRSFARAAVSGVPCPSFQLSFNLNDGQLLNIAALLSQANALHPQDPPHRWTGHR